MIPLLKEQKVPILMYHSISSNASPRFKPSTVSPETFADHLAYLSQHRYTPVTVTQLVQAMAQHGEDLPPRPVVLTFDDGYADFYTSAWPALQRYDFTATLYIATGFVGSTSRWLQYMGEGTRPLLNWTQLSELSAYGIECAAHTHTHPQLDMLPPALARAEIVRSKALLEDHLGQEVSSFAYPYGYYSPRVRRMVQRAGFASACAVKLAISSLHDHPYELARIAIRPHTTVDELASTLDTGRGPLVASPMKRIRASARQYARSVYGSLTCSQRGHVLSQAG